jgi:membrane associated rhomboid family serine protease
VIPLSDDNPTLRTPIVTYLLLGALGAAWVLLQGLGFNEVAMAMSVCNLGMVPGELTGLAPVGEAVPIGPRMACVVDREAINVLTPLTSMFLHGGWAHLLGNSLYLWVFGNNVEDSMGRGRFLVFYLLCGLAAAAAHVAVEPGSAVPTIGASGAISGVMGAYLVLYPRVRVNMLFIFFIFIRIIPLPAWLVLIWWIGTQLLSGVVDRELAQGVAFWAHIGGFFAGVALVKLFENRGRVRERTVLRHRFHPGEP